MPTRSFDPEGKTSPEGFPQGQGAGWLILI